MTIQTYRCDRSIILLLYQVKGGGVGGVRCDVCSANVAFGRTVSVCKFCDRTVHPGCEAEAPKDCGLSSDLALVLKSSAANTKEVLQKGYLKVYAAQIAF